MKVRILLLLRPHILKNFKLFTDVPDFSGENSNLKHYHLLEASKSNFLYSEASKK